MQRASGKKPFLTRSWQHLAACLATVAVVAPRFAGRMVMVLWLAMATHPGWAGSETTPAVPSDLAAQAGMEAVGRSPVIVDGRTLFSVRGVSSLPSEQRATNIAARIIQAGQDARLDPQQLRMVAESPVLTSIKAGEQSLMAVVDADGQMEGVQHELLAQAYLDRIRQAIRDYRNERSQDYLLNSGLLVLVASAILILVLYVLRWLFRRARTYMERIASQRMEALEQKTFSLVRAQQILGIVLSSITLVYWVLALIALDAYLSYVLQLFPWTRPFAALLLHTLLTPLGSIGQGVVDALPGVVFIVILVVALRYLLGLLRLFFAGIAEGSITWKGIEPEWAFPTYRLVRLMVIGFGLVMAYPYIPGSGSEAFKGLSILFGVLISLGSSSIIGNTIAGYSLIYRRAFKVGDRIKVGEHIGDVTEIGALVTHLRSPKNEAVVVPNSEILNSSIVNYSALKQQGLALHTTVGIGYETPWRQVEAMLKMAADRTPGLLRQPEPFVLQKSLGDFCIVYEINVYTDKPEQMFSLYTLLHQNIQDVFNEYGVQIMTPAYERDPPEPKVVPRKDWYLAPARQPGDQEAGATGSP